MPKTPRGKRVVGPATESFRVVNKAPNREAQPYFDKSRDVWVAPCAADPFSTYQKQIRLIEA